ncbi:aromatic amino acid ammonia-lyase [Arsenicicoccus piscis]|uniref:Histidine ammonia-lyase n=1 Tax=Arsenicicoccus piscis TaxID=673954 RepID=A0ABQ6HUB6_9MICO|nr:aromatic amino acid ammonia-lyase [Arsenicicoccus piscis]GMA21165.1 histidine ammonia-lyase [Arsenicicoccus piscis]
MPHDRGTLNDARRMVTIGEQLSAKDVADLAIGHAVVHVDLPRVHERLGRARAVVETALASGMPTYGLNRGLGPLRNSEVPLDLMGDFQRFVIVSHAAAIGTPLTRAEGRATLLARLNTLAAGGSGASVALFDGLLDLLTHDVIPVIPAQGSVGAADLSQMAAIGLVLLGEGRAWLPGEDRVVPGAEALAAAGLRPLVLGAKDGLALVGSNALSVASAALTHRRTELIAQRADLVAALTIEALDANLSPFDEVALAARPHPGQLESGARVRAALAGGDLAEGRVYPGSVQDPISIRTVPQVHGALVDELRVLDEMIRIELSCAPDNPYLDVDRGVFISNGNFSITGLAVGFDSVRVALAHVAMLSERRVAQLVRELRHSVTLAEQIQSTISTTGYVTPVILAQTASALVAQVKHAATPVSLTGTTVGDGVEDHASMAYPAVRVTDDILDVVERLFAVEALLAATIIDAGQRRAPRALGAPVARLAATITEITKHNDVTSDVVSWVTEALRRERRGDDHSEMRAPAVPEPHAIHDQEVARHDQLH